MNAGLVVHVTISLVCLVALLWVLGSATDID